MMVPPSRMRVALWRGPLAVLALSRTAGEFSEGGRLPEAERILDHILSAAPVEPLALHHLIKEAAQRLIAPLGRNVGCVS